MNGLNKTCKEFHQKAKDKDFWDSERELGTLLMLVVSELSEALEADRKHKYADLDKMQHDEPFKQAFENNVKDTVEDEIADVFIRLFDLVGYLGIDIEKHIELKMQYNQTREYKHGKKY